MFLLLQFSVGILLLLPVFPFIAKYTVQDGSYFFAPNIHPSWVAIAVKHQTDTDEYALGHDIVFIWQEGRLKDVLTQNCDQ